MERGDHETRAHRGATHPEDLSAPLARAALTAMPLASGNGLTSGGAPASDGSRGERWRPRRATAAA
jgi:hypothetical protein